MPLSRKVQLAVSAFARHKHTDYDKLLKQRSWQDARALVEPHTLHQLKIWRGEESAQSETENVLREIIVLDDESDTSDADASNSDNGDDVESVEFVAQNVRGDNGYLEQYVMQDSANNGQRTYLARRRQTEPFRLQRGYSDDRVVLVQDDPYRREHRETLQPPSGSHAVASNYRSHGDYVMTDAVYDNKREVECVPDACGFFPDDRLKNTRSSYVARASQTHAPRQASNPQPLFWQVLIFNIIYIDLRIVFRPTVRPTASNLIF